MYILCLFSDKFLYVLLVHCTCVVVIMMSTIYHVKTTCTCTCTCKLSGTFVLVVVLHVQVQVHCMSHYYCIFFVNPISTSFLFVSPPFFC